MDILSVIATLFGVCTSLGLGTIQINRGLHLLNPDIPISTNTQLGIIWAITAVATVSVLSGVKYGIRRISELCFGLGLVLMFTVLFLDNTVFLLNLYTQAELSSAYDYAGRPYIALLYWMVGQSVAYDG